MNLMKFARINQKLSQDDLAKDTRIGQWWISLLEAGTAVPQGDQSLRIGRRLGINPDDIQKEVTPVTEPKHEETTA